MICKEAALDEASVLEYVERTICLSDSAFERYYGLLLHAASMCNGSLYQKYLQRYEELCAASAGEDLAADKTVTVQPRYDAERNALTLDADRFDCHNIADAVAITARILNL